jgi:murein DD-endopeptidase MepM/ murein hydrolase activator NlpD
MHTSLTRRALIGLAALLAIALSTGTALGDQQAAPGPSVERFHWPLAPPHPVLRRFQAPSTPYGPGHRGVDLGGRVDEQVLAAGSGLVLYAGPLADRSLVSIEHEGGLRTTYEPITPSVRVGQYVQRGQVIGTLQAGHPGCPATAPTVCLHWGAHRQKIYLDPLPLVEPGQVRLLPWPDDVP